MLFVCQKLTTSERKGKGWARKGYGERKEGKEAWLEQERLCLHSFRVMGWVVHFSSHQKVLSELMISIYVHVPKVCISVGLW